MFSLFLDTHGKEVVVVLYKDGVVFDSRNLLTVNKHSEVTLPTIKEILDANKLDVHDLGEVIVVNGPGSFTGERIAVTICKTLAYTLNIPIKVVSSLEVMAVNLTGVKTVAIEDKNGAFVAKFDENNNLVGEMAYLNNSAYSSYKADNGTITGVEIDYNKVYNYVSKLENVKPHEVKPLYIKGISALNGR